MEKAFANIDHAAQIIGHGLGVCPICETKSGKRLVWDHDHATGKFRGYICAQRNAALGMFKDDATVVLRAVAYLTKLS